MSGGGLADFNANREGAKMNISMDELDDLRAIVLKLNCDLQIMVMRNKSRFDDKHRYVIGRAFHRDRLMRKTYDFGDGTQGMEWQEENGVEGLYAMKTDNHCFAITDLLEAGGGPMRVEMTCHSDCIGFKKVEGEEVQNES